MSNHRVGRGRPLGAKLDKGHRERIAAAQIVKRLEAFAKAQWNNGERPADWMAPHQVTAALGLLRKVMPDLASVENTGTVTHVFDHEAALARLDQPRVIDITPTQIKAAEAVGLPVLPAEIAKPETEPQQDQEVTGEEHGPAKPVLRGGAAAKARRERIRQQVREMDAERQHKPVVERRQQLRGMALESVEYWKREGGTPRGDATDGGMEPLPPTEDCSPT